MPVYVQCPHCEHPQVVSARRRGKALFCKQCGSAFQTSAVGDAVHPLWVTSISQLRQRSSEQRDVYLIEV